MDNKHQDLISKTINQYTAQRSFLLQVVDALKKTPWETHRRIPNISIRVSVGVLQYQSNMNYITW